MAELPHMKALVAPGRKLTNDELARYSRHLLIPDIDEVGQARLLNAKVLCVGAGGLGSPTILYLAAAGVGTIGILDYDNVEISNLQRQVIHTEADLGKSKVESAASKVRALNPSINLNLHEEKLTENNAIEIFNDYDLVIDGTDNFATRYLINDAAAILGNHTFGEVFIDLMDRFQYSGANTDLVIVVCTQRHPPPVWYQVVPKVEYLEVCVAQSELFKALKRSN